MSQDTREVCVLAAFKDADGVQRKKGDIFVVAYATDRQRKVVNSHIHRGFLTFDVVAAKEYLDQQEYTATNGETQQDAERKSRRRGTRSS